MGVGGECYPIGGPWVGNNVRQCRSGHMGPDGALDAGFGI